MQINGVLNPMEYKNCFIGSSVTAILLNWWILPIASERIFTQPAKQACLFHSIPFVLHFVGLLIFEVILFSMKDTHLHWTVLNVDCSIKDGYI